MSSFIPDKNTPPVAPVIISNETYFPDLDLTMFRDLMRADQTVSDAQAVQILTTAMIEVNRELKEWVAAQILAGYGSFTDIPATSFGVVTDMQHHYQAAIFNRAKALLVESYRDFDSTKSGHDKADEMDSRVDDYLRLSREAIRAIIGEPRLTVELI